MESVKAGDCLSAEQQAFLPDAAEAADAATNLGGSDVEAPEHSVLRQAFVRRSSLPRTSCKVVTVVPVVVLALIACLVSFDIVRWQPSPTRSDSVAKVELAAAPAKPSPKAKPNPAGCVDEGGDCAKVRCCTNPDNKCFQKNEFYAQCEKTCVAGVHNGKGSDGKPWSCNVLTHAAAAPAAPAAPAAAGCVGPGGDCTHVQCCTAGHQCFQKNQWYAQCKKTCKAGVNEKDKDKKPWSCNVLAKQPPAAHPSAPGPPIVCNGGALPSLPPYKMEGAQLQVKVLTYNLFWWNLYGVRHGNGESASHLIQMTDSPPYDFMGFQECEVESRVINDAGLGAQYGLLPFRTRYKTTALCIAYRKTVWNQLAYGQEWVAEDGAGQYYGKRAAQWLRAKHTVTGRTVFFMNHHGPLPVGTGGKCGGAVTAFKLMQVVTQHAQPGDAVVLIGDFNAGHGSETVLRLKQRLDNVFEGSVDGGIDNFFTNLPPSAMVSKRDLGGGGSDHHALTVTLQLNPAAGPGQPQVGPPVPKPMWKPKPKPAPAWKPKPKPAPAWKPKPKPAPAAPAWKPKPKPAPAAPAWKPKPKPAPAAPAGKPAAAPVWQPRIAGKPAPAAKPGAQGYMFLQEPQAGASSETPLAPAADSAGAAGGRF